MSKIEVNTVAPQCGTTLTLGESGDTVTLGTGASQSGFGRSGSVNWQTTIKTGDFTSVSGEGYFVDTGSGEIDVTLPSSPAAGDIVAVSDYAKNFGTNNCIMLRNGSNIQGAASNLTLDAEGLAMTFVYADATKGWIVVGAGREADKSAAAFVTATGGTIATCGNYKIHTFTGPGTFSVSCAGNSAGSTAVDYMVVAGGAAGANAKDGTNGNGGGGGAGGYRESAGCGYSSSPLGSGVSAITVAVQSYPIVVGAGGASSSTDDSAPGPGGGAPGNVSSGLCISSAGGGGGGRGAVGFNGGSGGGANCTGTAGSGNTPPVSPPQGNPGGARFGSGSCTVSGGGGGATATGGNGNPGGPAGPGGAGGTSSITGSAITRAGGGGGGGNSGQTGGGTGGSGGGGAGGAYNGGSGPTVNGTAGTANTGGGGGATASACSATPVTSGAGGSGIVIIRYKFQ